MRGDRLGPADQELRLSDTILHFYDRYDEARRLTRGHGLLERVRTQQIIARYLPESAAVIADVGGGPGAYAVWLAGLGHQVHLVDLSRRHVVQAQAAAQAAGVTLAGAVCGDARAVPLPDGFADVTLLLGPLYHLLDRTDRLTAWREAARITRPGGVVIGATISRWASAVDSLVEDTFDDPVMAQVIAGDIATGIHRNPTDDPGYFTTAYFHRPDELAAEVADAGLRWRATIGVEGPATGLPDLGTRLTEPDQRRRLLALLERLETVPALLGMSFHVLAVAEVG